MNTYDIILIAVLAVCVILAIFFTVRNRKKGCYSCGGCCESCAGCGAVQECDKKGKSS